VILDHADAERRALKERSKTDLALVHRRLGQHALRHVGGEALEVRGTGAVDDHAPTLPHPAFVSGSRGDAIGRRPALVARDRGVDLGIDAREILGADDVRIDELGLAEEGRGRIPGELLAAVTRVLQRLASVARRSVGEARQIGEQRLEHALALAHECQLVLGEATGAGPRRHHWSPVALAPDRSCA
jgi:hypothetical protein